MPATSLPLVPRTRVYGRTTKAMRQPAFRGSDSDATVQRPPQPSTAHVRGDSSRWTESGDIDGVTYRISTCVFGG